MISRLGVALSLCVSLLAGAAWLDGSGKPVPDTDSLRSSGAFGVQLVLTPDDAQFRKTWNSSKTPPQLRVTDRARRGSAISAMLVFSGCAANAAGNCDVVADFTLVDPGGKRLPGGSGPVWNLKPPASGNLQLSTTSATIGFDQNDPAGTYRVEAVVTDRVATRKLNLSAPFNVE